MTSVMWLVEEREASARARAEDLRVQAEQILAELAEVEAVLERRMIAREELAETLAARAGQAEVPAPGPDREPDKAWQVGEDLRPGRRARSGVPPFGDQFRRAARGMGGHRSGR